MVSWVVRGWILPTFRVAWWSIARFSESSGPRTRCGFRSYNSCWKLTQESWTRWKKGCSATSFFGLFCEATRKRGSRFLLYCHIPQLVLALLLLLRRLDAGFTNDLDPVKVALHGSAALAHRCLDIEFRKHPKSVGYIGFTGFLKLSGIGPLTTLMWSEDGTLYDAARFTFSMLTQVYTSISHTKCPKFVTEQQDESQAVHPSSSLPLSFVFQHVADWSFESHLPKLSQKHIPNITALGCNAWATELLRLFDPVHPGAMVAVQLPSPILEVEGGRPYSWALGSLLGGGLLKLEEVFPRFGSGGSKRKT